VDEVVSHSGHKLSRNFGIEGAKFLRESFDSFANDHQLKGNGRLGFIVFYKVGFTNALLKLDHFE
jgi:hypothetical protein